MELKPVIAKPSNDYVFLRSVRFPHNRVRGTNVEPKLSHNLSVEAVSHEYL